MSDNAEQLLLQTRATKVRNKVIYWNSQHSKPTPAEIRAEIKRLENLLLSHKALKGVSIPPRLRVYSTWLIANVMPQSVDKGTFHALLPADNPSDEALTKAYSSAYETLDSKAMAFIARRGQSNPVNEASAKPNGAFTDLLNAQAEWKKSSLSNNKKAVDSAQASEQKEVSGYLELKIQNIQLEIKDLKDLLPTTKAFLPEVLDEKGMQIADNDLKKTPGEVQVSAHRFILC